MLKREFTDQMSFKLTLQHTTHYQASLTKCDPEEWIKLHYNFQTKQQPPDSLCKDHINLIFPKN